MGELRRSKKARERFCSRAFTLPTSVDERMTRLRLIIPLAYFITPLAHAPVVVIGGGTACMGGCNSGGPDAGEALGVTGVGSLAAK